MNRGQKTLLLLVGLTVAPFLLAHVAYRYYEDAPRRPTTNKGEFVTAGTTIDALRLQPLPGPSLPTDKWRVLLYRPAQCDASCEEQLQRVRALPTLLGREGDRVAMLLIVERPDVAPNDKGPELPRALASGRIAQYRTGAFVVDPRGNVVLWYAPDKVGRPLLDDLKYMLKNSSIG